MKTTTCPNSLILYPTSYFQRAKFSFVEKVIKDEYGIDSNETLEFAVGERSSYLDMVWNAQDWYQDACKEEGCDSLARMKQIIIEGIEEQYRGIRSVHGFEPTPERYFPETNYPF